ncbi:MAG TPA: hypothetical protein VEJ36_05640 [Nitrososphaerales archaeon]|nr:hypothetical protein [Nitrososphaerales archaeon]
MKIFVGTLKDKGEDLSSFLEARVGTKPEFGGDSIEIDTSAARKGINTRLVKTYIKRFLFVNGVRSDYRVFVDGDELTIQELEGTEEEEEEKKEKKEKVKEKIEEAESREEEEPKAEEKPKEEVKPEKKKAKPPAKRKAKKPKSASGSKDG